MQQNATSCNAGIAQVLRNHTCCPGTKFILVYYALRFFGTLTTDEVNIYGPAFMDVEQIDGIWYTNAFDLNSFQLSIDWCGRKGRISIV
jgi:hypothetical protein